MLSSRPAGLCSDIFMKSFPCGQHINAKRSRYFLVRSSKSPFLVHIMANIKNTMGFSREIPFIVWWLHTSDASASNWIRHLHIKMQATKLSRQLMRIPSDKERCFRPPSDGNNLLGCAKEDPGSHCYYYVLLGTLLISERLLAMCGDIGNAGLHSTLTAALVDAGPGARRSRSQHDNNRQQQQQLHRVSSVSRLVTVCHCVDIDWID